MALKAHFTLLAFIVCTAYTSLRPFWTTVGASQRAVRGGGHLVHAADSFVNCESVRDLQKVKFSAKNFQGFWIKNFFFKNFVFRR